MKLLTLKSLIKRGESEVLEFKKSTALLHGAMQTLCAFLNEHQGGAVLIGVLDDGKIVGQNVTDGTKKEIAAELRKIEPHADVKVEYVHIEDTRYVIALSAQFGLKAPYVYDGRPFVRLQSTTHRMQQEEYEDLLHSRPDPKREWERQTTNTCSLNDLDKTRIKQIVKIAMQEGRLAKLEQKVTTSEILNKLGLIVNGRPTNAAVILFCKKQDKQFSQSMVKLARFNGLTKDLFIDQRIVRGNAFDLYEAAMAFLWMYLPVSSRIEGDNPFRIDTQAVPPKVLREALVNALCHRSYVSPGGSIAVGIYDDRIEIDSTGRLPRTIKLNELTKQHGSHPRNELIANAFYLCRMIEQWGKGTQEMIEICKQSGNPLPIYEEHTGSFSVILPLREATRRVVIDQPKRVIKPRKRTP